MTDENDDDDKPKVKSVMLKSEKGQAIVKEAIERATKTKETRAAFKQDPKAALLAVAREHHVELLIAELKFTVVENTKDDRFLVLPFDGELTGRPQPARPQT